MSRALPLLVETLPPDHILGLHMNWLEGSGNDVEFRMVTGAGLGNAMLGMSVTMPDGETVTETCDMTGLAQLWVAGIVEDYRKEKDQ